MSDQGGAGAGRDEFGKHQSDDGTPSSHVDARNLPTSVTQAPHWATAPTFRWCSQLLGQALTYVLMLAKLNPENWPHITCCIVLSVLIGMGLFRKSS